MSEPNFNFDDLDTDSTETERTAPRRGVDPVALIMGIAVLFASAYVLSDGPDWLPPFDPRWLVAGGAGLIGLIMLAVSLRPGRRRNR